MTITRAVVLTTGLLLLCCPALADSPPTYKEISAKRIKLDGKEVEFSYRFTKVQAAINPLLARRGISNKSYFEIKTTWKPLREGGSLIILGKRKNAKLLEACGALKTRQDVLMSGKIKHLTGDQGQTYYYLDLSAVSVIKPKKEKEPTGKSESGKKKKYLMVSTVDLAKTPLKYHGKRISVSVEYGGPAKTAPKWAYELAGVKTASVQPLRGTPRFSMLVKKSAKEKVAHLQTIKPGQAVQLFGVLKAKKVGRSVRTVLLVEKAAAPEKK